MSRFFSETSQSNSSPNQPSHRQLATIAALSATLICVPAPSDAFGQSQDPATQIKNPLPPSANEVAGLVIPDNFSANGVYGALTQSGILHALSQKPEKAIILEHFVIRCDQLQKQDGKAEDYKIVVGELNALQSALGGLRVQAETGQYPSTVDLETARKGLNLAFSLALEFNPLPGTGPVLEKLFEKGVEHAIEETVTSPRTPQEKEALRVRSTAVLAEFARSVSVDVAKGNIKLPAVERASVLAMTDPALSEILEKVLEIDLPSTPADLRQVFRTSPNLLDNRELAQYVVDLVSQGRPLTEPEKTRLASLAVSSMQAAVAPVAERGSNVISDLKQIDALVDEAKRTEALNSYRQRLDRVVFEASASLEGITSIVGLADPETARKVGIIGNGIIKTGSGIARLIGQDYSPSSFASVISGAISFTGLFGDEDAVAAQRHAEIMAAFNSVQTQIFEMHADITQARREINWMHRDVSSRLDNLTDLVVHVEGTMARGLIATNSILINIANSQRHTSDLLDQIKYDERWFAKTWLDAESRDRVQRVRFILHRELNRKVAPDPEGAEDACFEVANYAYIGSASYNLNGAYFEATHITDNEHFAVLQRRRSAELISLPPLLIEGASPYFPRGHNWTTARQQVPNPDEFVVTANAMIDLVLLNWKILAMAQSRENSKGVLGELETLLIEAKRLKEYVGALESRPLLIQAANNYKNVTVEFGMVMSREVDAGRGGPLPRPTRPGEEFSWYKAELSRVAPWHRSLSASHDSPQGSYRVDVPIPELDPVVRLATKLGSLQHSFTVSAGAEADIQGVKVNRGLTVSDTLRYIGEDGRGNKVNWVIYTRDLDLNGLNPAFSNAGATMIPWSYYGGIGEFQAYWNGDYSGPIGRYRDAMNAAIEAKTQEILALQREGTIKKIRIRPGGKSDMGPERVEEDTGVFIKQAEINAAKEARAALTRERDAALANPYTQKSLRDIYAEHGPVNFNVGNIGQLDRDVLAPTFANQDAELTLRILQTPSPDLERAWRKLKIAEFALDYLLSLGWENSDALRDLTVRFPSAIEVRAEAAAQEINVPGANILNDLALGSVMAAHDLSRKVSALKRAQPAFPGIDPTIKRLEQTIEFLTGLERATGRGD